jgi:geranylgeranyl diphosphate synthase, type I
VVEAFAELLAEVRPEVDAALAKIWDQERVQHSVRGAAVTGPLEAARDLCLRGGKRLRATLVVAGYRIGGGAHDWMPVLPVCCAVELVQAYFLIHDDWMDQDQVRRGGLAVHAALEAAGAPMHLAACGAVLAGDYTLALATRELSRARLPSERWPAVLSRFATLQLDAVVGQQMDVLGQGDNLEEMYRLKTASYTVIGPLELGLEAAGGQRPTRAELEAFAVPLGIAFQLRDDLIGALAAPAISGKPQGSDLSAGKRSLLIDTALRRADPSAAGVIRGVFGNRGVQPEELERALAAVKRSGAPEHVENRIAELSAQALAALDAPGFDADARSLLGGVRAALLDRVS